MVFLSSVNYAPSSLRKVKTGNSPGLWDTPIRRVSFVEKFIKIVQSNKKKVYFEPKKYITHMQKKVLNISWLEREKTSWVGIAQSSWWVTNSSFYVKLDPLKDVWKWVGRTDIHNHPSTGMTVKVRYDY